MNTCGTCIFRGKSIEHCNEETNFEYVPSTYFMCELIKHDDQFKYMRGSGALVTDGSGYKAALCVESDFGCNKWRPRFAPAAWIEL